MAESVKTLIVRDAAGSERVVPVDRDVITLGRDPTCTIRLESRYVSRQHARIETHGPEIVLVDLGSVNGSLLNGARVEGSAALSAGDVIAIADATIECRSEGAMDGTTLAFRRERPVPPPSDLLRVEPQAYEVWVGERLLERRLSEQEFKLLRNLYEHRDRVCTRQELGDAIWGSGNWDPNMLHRLVHRLKEKIEPNPEKPRYVQTVPWVGYRVTP